MPKGDGIRKHLEVQCKKHPSYTADRRPHSHCESCLLLYALRYQDDDEKAFENSIQYMTGNFEEACVGLRVYTVF